MKPSVSQCLRGVLFCKMVVLLGCSAPSGMGSIGAVLGRDAETRAVYVREVPEAGEAEKAGLVPGDEIVMIDGVFVRDVSAEELRLGLRGSPGSKVRLTVVRGGEVVRLEVVRTALKEARVLPREERIQE